MSATEEIGRRIAEVRRMVAAVRDPEIDETAQELDFIVDVTVSGGDVTISVRLPTYWCPVNFAWLIAQDMRASVLALPWVTGYKFLLVDHFAEAEINRGVNQNLDFEAVFQNQASGELELLKRAFAVKAMLIRQGRLIAALKSAGLPDPTICALTVATMDSRSSDATMGSLWSAVLEKRREAGLAIDANEPAICSRAGMAVTDLNAHLREIGRVANNAAASGEMCRMLVAARRAGEVGRRQSPTAEFARNTGPDKDYTK
jgi:metal-sulfur cluster biosynthetic enzyme